MIYFWRGSSILQSRLARFLSRLAMWVDGVQWHCGGYYGENKDILIPEHYTKRKS